MRTLIVAAMLLAASSAWAGSYTVTATPEEDRALVWAATQQKTTPATLMQQRVSQDVLRDLLARWRADRSAQYRQKLDALDATTKAKVLQDLGLSE